MKRRGLVALVVALVIVVVLVVAGGIWYWKAHESKANPAQSQGVGIIQTTSTYQNTDYGVSFDYPNNWVVKSGDAAEGDYGLYTPYGPYQNASTTVSLITVEIPPSFYPGTNLKGAYFNLSVNKQLSQSQCLALTSQSGPNNGGGKIVIGGVTFNWTRAGSTAAGTDEFSENYSGYTNNTCYEFNLGDTTGNDVSPTGTRMSSSANDISVLEGVLSSVKFINSTRLLNVASTINTSTWKTYDNGVFEYPPDWNAINGADLGNFADAAFTSPASTASITVGSRGCRPALSATTSSVVISGKTVIRIDESNEISICENATSSDGPGGGWSFDFGFNSTTTKAIDEAIISTLNLNNW